MQTLFGIYNARPRDKPSHSKGNPNNNIYRVKQVSPNSRGDPAFHLTNHEMDESCF